jgi:ribonucleoside-diphosphate reductase alpha chain
MAGEFVVVNRHLVRRLIDLGLWNAETRDAIVAADGSVQGIAGLSDHDKAVFKTAWELRQKALIDLSADRGPFVCQSQSLNLFVTEPTFKKLSSMHFYAFRKGLKTGMYYLRTQSASKPVQITIAAAAAAQPPKEPEECLMCSA